MAAGDSGFGIWIIFTILFLCGFGFPLPEEVLLIAAGYLAYRNDASLTSAVLVPMAAILLGDAGLFFLGQKFGIRIFEFRAFRRFLKRDRLRRSRRWMDRYGHWIVFAGRFLAGFRIPIFLTAAIFRMSMRRFLFIDFLGALVSVPLSVLLAYHYGDKIQQFLKFMNQAKFTISLSVVTIVGVYLLFRRFQKKKAVASYQHEHE